MSKKKWAIIAIILLAVPGIYYYYITIYNNNISDDNISNQNNIKINLTGLPPEINSSLSQLVNKTHDLDENSLNYLKPWQNNRIDSSLPFVVEIQYLDGLTKKQFPNIPSSFEGMTVEQLNEVGEEWQVVSYGQRGLHLKYKTNQVSPQSKHTFCISVKDNKVAIYYDKEKNHLKQITDIDINDLPEKEKKALNKGIFVTSEEELLAVLDGILSIIRE